MNLVASVIAKNELGRYLQECVASLREFCDRIAVVDDGSTDRTGEWLDDNADDQLHVMHIDPEDGFFAGHEGRRRQALLDFTMGQEPSHILVIDADEFVTDGLGIRTWCDNPRRPVWSLQMEEIWGVDGDNLLVRDDGGWRPHPVPILFQPHPGPQWHINDKALACGREPMAIRRSRARPSGVSVLHFGWACEADRQARYERYVVADGGRFHANSHLQSIMWGDDKVQTHTRPWPAFLEPRKPALTERIERGRT